LFLVTIVDGKYSDGYVPEGDTQDELLREWQAGRFLHYGEVLHTRWTSEEEAAHLRRTQFGPGEDWLLPRRRRPWTRSEP
jgi:hypothetical protein